MFVWDPVVMDRKSWCLSQWRLEATHTPLAGWTAGKLEYPTSTQPDGGLGHPVKGTISRMKAPCITQVYCYTTTEGNIDLEGGREGNLKRTVDERLAAARENSLIIVGNDAQGTKPLTWQQRKRIEGSADALASILRCTTRSPRRRAGRCVRVSTARQTGV